MIPIFTGIINQGVIKKDTPQRFTDYIQTLEGHKVEIIVRKKKAQRSNNQNNAYWGIVIPLLSDTLGYDKDEIHEILKIKFASRIDDKGLTIVESTSKMDTKRFSQYYEDIQRWSVEFLGVNIPSPNEYNGWSF